MKTALILTTLVLCACAGGNSYMSVYDRYRAEGLSHAEAIKSADFYCLNNPCRWG